MMNEWLRYDWLPILLEEGGFVEPFYNTNSGPVNPFDLNTV